METGGDDCVIVSKGQLLQVDINDVQIAGLLDFGSFEDAVGIEVASHIKDVGATGQLDATV